MPREIQDIHNNNDNLSLFCFIDFIPKKVWLTPRQFDDLAEYSASYPTGQTIGKRWKRQMDNVPNGFIMCEFADHPTNPDLIRILTFDIIIVNHRPAKGNRNG